ncbi:hypothetical protein V8C44DRAFT_14324 [Trichoderma aethiopicum]
MGNWRAPRDEKGKHQGNKRPDGEPGLHMTRGAIALQQIPTLPSILGLSGALSGQRSTCYPTRPIGRAAPLVGRREERRGDSLKHEWVLFGGWCLARCSKASCVARPCDGFPKRRIRGEDGGRAGQAAREFWILGGSAWGETEAWGKSGSEEKRREAGGDGEGDGLMVLRMASSPSGERRSWETRIERRLLSARSRPPSRSHLDALSQLPSIPTLLILLLPCLTLPDSTLCSAHPKERLYVLALRSGCWCFLTRPPAPAFPSSRSTLARRGGGIATAP